MRKNYRKVIILVTIMCMLVATLSLSGCSFLDQFRFNTPEGIPVEYEDISFQLPNDYAKSYLQDYHFAYYNGTFVIAGRGYTESDFMGIGTTIEDEEHFAQFMMDLNPEYTFSELKEKDDYLYFSYEGVVNNISHTKLASVFKHKDTFYFISMECETSNEYLLEDAFFEIMDTLEFE